ncbi:peptide deformylase [Streptomyces sp. SBT349]|uniref:peptide deformylase n=1 Tax=Streptomyces sp. SBT349 TaxID=1580539 RepID=UPI00066D5788|nr:peptide deformylase [Streptomyces sp. SBT349]
MAQQETDERVSDEFIDDTKDSAEREQAHRERGTVRPITVVGHPMLHRECRDVTAFDEALASLIDDMFASQRAAEGVGLAANQIGVDLKVFVYDCPDDDGVRHVGAVCNPVLDELPPDGRVLDDNNEGCLSVPGAYAELPRPDYAVVRGQDATGRPVTVRGTGYFARCLQHETDHLYGHLYLERLSKRERKKALTMMAENTPRYETVPNAE